MACPPEAGTTCPTSTQTASPGFPAHGTMKPSIATGPGFYEFTWPDYPIQVRASHLRQHSDGRVTGEMLITSTVPGLPTHLHQAQFNFSSSRSRSELARILKERVDTVDWGMILEQAAVLTIRSLRQGEATEELWSSDELIPPQWLVHPLIQQNHPTIIFGEKGVGKSLLGLLSCVLTSLPWSDNPLSLSVERAMVKSLYLDWESSRDETLWRLKCLAKGMELPAIPLNYRRQFLPLAQDVEQVQEHIRRLNIKFLIIDSLGLACGGDLNKTEPALAFFQALRQLNVTSLLLAQTAKNEQGRKTTYGNALFTYMARSIWELRGVSEEGESELHVGLFHRNANFGSRHSPFGFCFHFDNPEDSIQIEAENIRSVPELTERMALRQQIVELLKGGALTKKDISEQLSAKPDSIKAILWRFKGKLFINLDPGAKEARWGLITHDSTEAAP